MVGYLRKQIKSSHYGEAFSMPGSYRVLRPCRSYCSDVARTDCRGAKPGGEAYL
jgi:hypothetical protein